MSSDNVFHDLAEFLKKDQKYYYEKIILQHVQPVFSRLLRFFYSTKILDGDWSISEIPVYDRFSFAE